MRATNVCASVTRSRPRRSSPHRVPSRRTVRLCGFPGRAAHRARGHILSHHRMRSSRRRKSPMKTCIRLLRCKQILRELPQKNLIALRCAALPPRSMRTLHSQESPYPRANDNARSNYYTSTRRYRATTLLPCRFNTRTVRSSPFCFRPHTITSTV